MTNVPSDRPLKEDGILPRDQHEPVRNLFQGTLMWPISYSKWMTWGCSILKDSAASEWGFWKETKIEQLSFVYKS